MKLLGAGERVELGHGVVAVRQEVEGPVFGAARAHGRPSDAVYGVTLDTEGWLEAEDRQALRPCERRLHPLQYGAAFATSGAARVVSRLALVVIVPNYQPVEIRTGSIEKTGRQRKDCHRFSDLLAQPDEYAPQLTLLHLPPMIAQTVRLPAGACGIVVAGSGVGAPLVANPGEIIALNPGDVWYGDDRRVELATSKSELIAIVWHPGETPTSEQEKRSDQAQGKTASA